jgi:serine/threonine protein kinase
MQDLNDIPTEILDEQGNVHHLDESLGSGGQGAVFRTTDPDVAVKFLTNRGGSPVTDKTLHQKYNRKMEEVRTLPVPDLNLAMPITLLAAPHTGYVMRLLSDMVPVQSLIVPPRPPGAGDEKAENISLTKFYNQTGGLRRRLLLLASIAGTLSRLHAIPLTYGDISDQNVFVSENTKHTEAWLIDADNLRFLSKSSPTIYTPGFGAPEVVQGRSGVNTLSDAHGFAVLAYWVLSLQHPFIGDYVENQGGWDNDHSGEDDPEERAYAGEIPWILDEIDDINRTEMGLKPQIILTPQLRDLFRKAFTHGRTDPLARPDLRHWIEALYQAADNTLKCPNPGCRATYYFDSYEMSCPFCGRSRPGVIYIQVLRWDPEIDDGVFDPGTGGLIHENLSSQFVTQVWQKFTDLAETGEQIQLPKRLFSPITLENGHGPGMDLKFMQHSIKLKISLERGDNHQLFIALPDTREFRAINRQVDLPLPQTGKDWYIHCGHPDTPHRLLKFTYLEPHSE